MTEGQLSSLNSLNSPVRELELRPFKRGKLSSGPRDLSEVTGTGGLAQGLARCLGSHLNLCKPLLCLQIQLKKTKTKTKKEKRKEKKGNVRCEAFATSCGVNTPTSPISGTRHDAAELGVGDSCAQVIVVSQD